MVLVDRFNTYRNHERGVVYFLPLLDLAGVLGPQLMAFAALADALTDIIEIFTTFLFIRQKNAFCQIAGNPTGSFSFRALLGIMPRVDWPVYLKLTREDPIRTFDLVGEPPSTVRVAKYGTGCAINYACFDSDGNQVYTSVSSVTDGVVFLNVPKLGSKCLTPVWGPEQDTITLGRYELKDGEETYGPVKFVELFRTELSDAITNERRRSMELGFAAAQNQVAGSDRKFVVTEMRAESFALHDDMQVSALIQQIDAIGNPIGDSIRVSVNRDSKKQGFTVPLTEEVTGGAAANLRLSPFEKGDLHFFLLFCTFALLRGEGATDFDGAKWFRISPLDGALTHVEAERAAPDGSAAHENAVGSGSKQTAFNISVSRNVSAPTPVDQSTPEKVGLIWFYEGPDGPVHVPKSTTSNQKDEVIVPLKWQNADGTEVTKRVPAVLFEFDVDKKSKCPNYERVKTALGVGGKKGVGLPEGALEFYFKTITNLNCCYSYAPDERVFVVVCSNPPPSGDSAIKIRKVPRVPPTASGGQSAPPKKAAIVTRAVASASTATDEQLGVGERASASTAATASTADPPPIRDHVSVTSQKRSIGQNDAPPKKAAIEKLGAATATTSDGGAGAQHDEQAHGQGLGGAPTTPPSPLDGWLAAAVAATATTSDGGAGAQQDEQRGEQGGGAAATALALPMRDAQPLKRGQGQSGAAAVAATTADGGGGAQHDEQAVAAKATATASTAPMSWKPQYKRGVAAPRTLDYWLAAGAQRRGEQRGEQHNLAPDAQQPKKAKTSKPGPLDAYWQ